MPGANQRPAKAAGRATQGSRTGHEGLYSPAVAWRRPSEHLLWPGEAAVDACPRLEVVKRSICIEGARRAFARVKLQWVKLDAVKLIKEGPPQGKEHRTPEIYYEGVLKGARIVADECSKDAIFE